MGGMGLGRFLAGESVRRWILLSGVQELLCLGATGWMGDGVSATGVRTYVDVFTTVAEILGRIILEEVDSSLVPTPAHSRDIVKRWCGGYIRRPAVSSAQHVRAAHGTADEWRHRALSQWGFRHHNSCLAQRRICLISSSGS